MKDVTFHHQETGNFLRCQYSPWPLFKMKGLLGRTSLEPATGIWLKPCNAIHMFFMKMPIDVLFLDRSLRIVRIYPSIAPWKMTPPILNAHSCIEIGAGECARLGISEGSKFEIVG